MTLSFPTYWFLRRVLTGSVIGLKLSLLSIWTIV